MQEVLVVLGATGARSITSARCYWQALVQMVDNDDMQGGWKCL